MEKKLEYNDSLTVYSKMTYTFWRISSSLV